MTLADKITSILIEPTTHCNARCPQCARFTEQGYIHPDLVLGHLGLETLIKIHKTDLPNLTRIQFEGDKGDPCMVPYLDKWIDHFSWVKQIGLVTNGSIGTRQWWQNLAIRKNVLVTFSIDGLEDTNHLYRVDVAWHRVMRNAQAFINSGGRAIWKCVVFQHNQDQLDQIRQLAHNMGFVRVEFTHCDINRFNDNPTFPVYREGVFLHSISPGQLPRQDLYKKSINFKGSNKYWVYDDKVNSELRCPYLQRNTVYINYRGWVIPCCMMHWDLELDYPGTHSLRSMLNGNTDLLSLNHYTIREILSNKFYSTDLNQSLESKKTALFQCARSCGHVIPNS